jgi:hypothetical protein
LVSGFSFPEGHLDLNASDELAFRDTGNFPIEGTSFLQRHQNAGNVFFFAHHTHDDKPFGKEVDYGRKVEFDRNLL